MSIISYESRNLNIKYDLPDRIWENISEVYKEMEGWLGYGNGHVGEEGIPYWFSFNEEEKCINASVEPIGLQFSAFNMDEQDWENWLKKIKNIATKILGFKVGELENGEVGYDIEWV